METKFIYKIAYLFIILIGLFSGIACTCPPFVPCKSDEDCSENRICEKYGECLTNPCLNTDCGKGECIIDRERIYNSKLYYCECKENAVLYQGICVPICEQFSEECQNFNLKDRELHECNTELGHCDKYCKGENSCKEGYFCSNIRECRKECNNNSECRDNEYCTPENTCKINDCLSKSCGKGECILNKTEGTSHCECDDGAIKNEQGSCYTPCNNYTDCEDEQYCHDNMCIPNLPCKDIDCGLGSCTLGYNNDWQYWCECNNDAVSIRNRCKATCNIDEDCGDGICDSILVSNGRDKEESKLNYCECNEGAILIGNICYKECQTTEDCLNTTCENNLCGGGACKDIYCGEGTCIEGDNPNTSTKTENYYCECSSGSIYKNNICYPKCVTNTDCNGFTHMQEGGCVGNVCYERCTANAYFQARTCNEGYFCSDETGKCELEE